MGSEYIDRDPDAILAAGCYMGFHMVRRLRQHRSDERRPCMGRTISLVF